MVPLSPSEAANIARGAYNIRQAEVSKTPLLGIKRTDWEPVGSRIMARSGIGFASAESGFGYVCVGKAGSQRAGEILVATRGTKTLLDWLSNANVDVTSGPKGLPVHTGFNALADVAVHDVNIALKNRNPTHIHCVGHSLGGAIATLVAGKLVGEQSVSVYSFGQPRVGWQLFSDWLTGEVGGKIYRLANVNDPVPMVPIFPFIHAPTDQSSYIVPAVAMRLSPTNHYMETGYLPAGLERKSWGDLRDGGSGTLRVDIKDWLSSGATSGGPITMGSTTALMLITRALQWVLEQELFAILTSLGQTIARNLTALDKIMYLLKAGCALSKKAWEHLKVIALAIFGFLGRTMRAAKDISIAFLRWTFDLLYQSLSTMAHVALMLDTLI